MNIGELTQHVDTTAQHSVCPTPACKWHLADTLNEGERRLSASRHAQVNVVNFDILVFGKFKGSLTIEASYKPVGPSRVAISLERASLVPQQFQQLFDKNYDLLLAIFNPDGWLDITYVDDQHRIGRDDKGNVFVLERVS